MTATHNRRDVGYRGVCWTVGLLSALTGGCFSSGNPGYLVGGAVSWQGAPVDRGDIIFIPLDKRHRAEATKIVAGRFQLRLSAGEHRVQIFAQRELPGQSDAVMGTPLLEAYIPAEFNTKSTLAANVEPRDDNQVDFHLSAAAER